MGRLFIIFKETETMFLISERKVKAVCVLYCDVGYRI